MGARPPTLSSPKASLEFETRHLLLSQGFSPWPQSCCHRRKSPQVSPCDTLSTASHTVQGASVRSTPPARCLGDTAWSLSPGSAQPVGRHVALLGLPQKYHMPGGFGRRLFPQLWGRDGHAVCHGLFLSGVALPSPRRWGMASRRAPRKSWRHAGGDWPGFSILARPLTLLLPIPDTDHLTSFQTRPIWQGDVFCHAASLRMAHDLLDAYAGVH